MATRASTADPWEPPTQIPGIKSGAAPDTTPWIDASLTVLYFTSEREATTENPTSSPRRFAPRSPMSVHSRRSA